MAAAAAASAAAASPDEAAAASGERAARAQRLCARPVPDCPLVLDDDDDQYGGGRAGSSSRPHDTIHLAASAGREAPAPAAAPAAAATAPSRPLSPPPAPRLHGDPDYELPQGRLTETSALRRRAAADAAARRQAAPLPPPPPPPPAPAPEQQQQQQQEAPLPRVDRYGFFLPESEDAVAGGPSLPEERERHRRAVEQWRRMIQGGGGGGGAQGRPAAPPSSAASSSAADAAADALEAWFARHPRRAKKLMRAGVPDEFRGLAWHTLSGGRALARLSSEAAATVAGTAAAATPTPTSSSSSSSVWPPRPYPLLLDAAASDGDERADTEILRDLGRTFPGHALLQQRQGPGQRALFQVLRAYRALDPEVGYVQGMAFVVGVLLMYLPEEAAFWTFAGLMLGGVEGAREVQRQQQELQERQQERAGARGAAAAPPPEEAAAAAVPAPLKQPQPALRRLPLRGMFVPGMPELKSCMRRFERLLALRHPPLGRQLKSEGVDPSLYCAPWFPTMYAYSLPFPHVLRVWDVLLAEGLSPKPMHRVGLALVGSAARGLSALPFESLVPALNGTGPPVGGGGGSHADEGGGAGGGGGGGGGRRSSWRRKRRAGAATAASAAAAAAPSGGGGAGRRRPRFPILGRAPDALIRAACRIKVSRALRQIAAAELAEAAAEEEASAARRRAEVSGSGGGGGGGSRSTRVEESK